MGGASYKALNLVNYCAFIESVIIIQEAERERTYTHKPNSESFSVAVTT